jgi:hypothetical protein
MIVVRMLELRVNDAQKIDPVQANTLMVILPSNSMVLISVLVFVTCHCSVIFDLLVRSCYLAL